MMPRRYLVTELDAAQRYARRLRDRMRQPVRVIRGKGQIIVAAVDDERRIDSPHEPDRRAAAGSDADRRVA